MSFSRDQALQGDTLHPAYSCQQSTSQYTGVQKLYP